MSDSGLCLIPQNYRVASLKLRMLKCHLIGSWRENYLGFANTSVKNSSADAHERYEKMPHYVQRHSWAASSGALRWCRFMRSQTQDQKQWHVVKLLFSPKRWLLHKDRAEGGNHISFHSRRMEERPVAWVFPKRSKQRDTKGHGESGAVLPQGLEIKGQEAVRTVLCALWWALHISSLAAGISTRLRF